MLQSTLFIGRLKPVLSRPHLLSWVYAGQPGVLACSALKKAYRQLLATGLWDRILFVFLDVSHPADDQPVAARHAIFIHLRPTCPRYYNTSMQGSFELIMSRMKARQGHFMPPTLLQSQFEALQRPDGGEPALTVDINRTEGEGPMHWSGIWMMEKKFYANTEACRQPLFLVSDEIVYEILSDPRIDAMRKKYMKMRRRSSDLVSLSDFSFRQNSPTDFFLFLQS